jgi:hypothetical protein
MRLIEFAPGTVANPPAKITRMTVTVWRTLSTFVFACENTSSVEFHVETAPGVDLGRLGLRLKVVRGELPFYVPEFAVTLGADGVAIQSWIEAESRTRMALRARLAAQLVSSDGTQGPWIEFDVDEPSQPPAVYVHPALLSLLRAVQADPTPLCTTYALGGRGHHVEDPAALTPTIKAALDSGEVSCVNVPIDPEFVLKIGASKLSV